jgi:hypothetical protein
MTAAFLFGDDVKDHSDARTRRIPKVFANNGGCLLDFRTNCFGSAHPSSRRFALMI